MTLSHSARILLVVALASASGCANTPSKGPLPWWPQGPGNPPGSEPAEKTSEESVPSAAATAAPAPKPSAPAAKPSAPAQPTQQASAPAAAAPAAAAGPATPDSETQATRYGDLLFLSGQTAPGGDIAQQTRAAMQKVAAILESHRLTMANIVHVTVHLANIKDLPGMEAAYAAAFRGASPARTVVEAAHLPGDALVQISVIAGR